MENPAVPFVIRLGREARISNALLPRGASVGLDAAGRLKFVNLPHDMEIQGLVCRGGDYTKGFHPNGKLAEAWLARDQVIHGVPCEGAAPTQLWPDGSLKYCRAAREITLQGVTFKTGDPVRLDEQGHLAASAIAGKP
jgi:hypothetical protein